MKRYPYSAAKETIDARRTGRMPAPGCWDFLRADGEYITVYSGHLVVRFSDSSIPEFYCVELPLETDPAPPVFSSLSI